MSKGTMFALLALAAYLGFEGYAVKKVSHRTEPAYIYQLLIEADAAAQVCKSSVLELQTRFDKTLARVKEQYAQDLASEPPGMSPQAVSQLLEERNNAAEQKLQSRFQETGCESPEMKADFQRYRIYARRSR